ncbi:hypothetical protein [Kineococcus xinjiangensis]|nr:hypothetical protein [Kineococcus xinjiangensis]
MFDPPGSTLHEELVAEGLARKRRASALVKIPGRLLHIENCD